MRGKGEGGVYRRPDGYWAASLELPSRDGKRRRKVVSAKTKTEVLAKLGAARAQLQERGDLPTASMTTAQWFGYWMREIVANTRQPETFTSYRAVVDRWIVPAIGNVRLDKVSPATIRRVLSTMEDAGRSSTYQRNAHSVMSAAFKDAEREGRMPRNPVELVVAPVKAVTHLEALTPEEAARLIRTFGDSPDAFLWATFLLTGARRGEVLGLEWDRVSDELDISWQLTRIGHNERKPAGMEYRHVEGGLYWTRPKSKAGWRVIPLVDPLAGILARWRELAPSNPWGLVFTRPDATGRPLPVDPDYASKLWPEVLKAAGITKHVGIHGLRHTAVDLLLNAGVPDDLVKDIVGHSTVAMTRYYKTPQNRLRMTGAMNQLTEYLGV